jgi:hypothetical protein
LEEALASAAIMPSAPRTRAKDSLSATQLKASSSLIGLLGKNDPFLINFFGTHRHTNTDIYLATQHLNTGANTTLREITTYAILFGRRQKNTIESLFDNFGQLFENIKAFKEHYFKITSAPFTAMLYDNRNEEFDDNYKSFKAPDMSKVKMKLDFSNSTNGNVIPTTTDEQKVNTIPNELDGNVAALRYLMLM